MSTALIPSPPTPLPKKGEGRFEAQMELIPLRGNP
jgi:hypothetical protein